jgi:hypothetical protein
VPIPASARCSASMLVDVGVGVGARVMCPDGQRRDETRRAVE